MQVQRLPPDSEPDYEFDALPTDLSTDGTDPLPETDSLPQRTPSTERPNDSDLLPTKADEQPLTATASKLLPGRDPVELRAKAWTPPVRTGRTPSGVPLEPVAGLHDPGQHKSASLPTPTPAHTYVQPGTKRLTSASTTTKPSAHTYVQPDEYRLLTSTESNNNSYTGENAGVTTTTVGPPPGERKPATCTPDNAHHAHLNPFKNNPEDASTPCAPAEPRHSGTADYRSSAAPGSHAPLVGPAHAYMRPGQNHSVYLSNHVDSFQQSRVRRDQYESAIYPPQKPQVLDDFSTVYHRRRTFPLDEASRDAAFTSELLPAPPRDHYPSAAEPGIKRSSSCSLTLPPGNVPARHGPRNAKAVAHQVPLHVDHDSNGLNTDTIADHLPHQPVAGALLSQHIAADEHAGLSYRVPPVGSSVSDLSSLSCTLSHSSGASDTEDVDGTYRYQGPDFYYDTGATGSFGSLSTPLTNSRRTTRRIGGIGGVVVSASKEGTCHAIPNVALSSGIHRNLAGVSQLARHYDTTLTFTSDKVYGIAPEHVPIHRATCIGEATPNGLYRMNMNQFSRHVTKPTELTSGEAARAIEATKVSTPAKATIASASAPATESPTTEATKASTSTPATTTVTSLKGCQALQAGSFHNLIDTSSYYTPRFDFLSEDEQEDSSDCGEPFAHAVERASPVTRPSRASKQPLTADASNSQAASHDAVVTNNYCYLSDQEEAQVIADYKPSENAMLLHTRMGHASKKAMIRALKAGNNLGIPITLHELIHANIFCKACAETHITRKPFPRSSDTKPHKTILGLIHSDTAGPRVTSLKYQDHNKHLTGNFRYWQVYVDDHSKYIWTNFLQRKSQLPKKMRTMRNLMELDARDSKQHPGPGLLPLRVLAYRTDNAGELTSKQAIKRLLQAMVDHERTVPNASSQNPHAEIAIKVIQDMARTLLHCAKLPAKYWPFAIQCATHLVNRLPCQTNPDNKSRYEMFTGRKPDYARAKTFGAIVTKYLPIWKRKHGDKQSPSGQGGTRHRLIGYPRKTKGYFVLDTEKQPYPMVFVCRNIHLQEDTTQFPDMSSSSEESDSNLDYLTTSGESNDSPSLPYSSPEAFSPDEDSDLYVGPDPDLNQSTPSDSGPSSSNDNQAVEDDFSHDAFTSTDESAIELLDDPDEVRSVVRSRARDTVNKLARRYRCDARLLCRVNHGVKDPNDHKRKLSPSDHLIVGTELYLPTQKDKDDYRTLQDAKRSDSSSSSDEIEQQAPAATLNQESKADSAPADSSANYVQQPLLQRYGSYDQAANSNIVISDAAPIDVAHLSSLLPEPELENECIPMMLDNAAEAYTEHCAAAYAATPTLSAHNVTEELLHLCHNAIRQGFERAYLSHGTKECDRTIKVAKREASAVFHRAFQCEQAHLVESLRHIPARTIPTPKNHAEAIKSEFQDFWNEAIAQEIANLKAYGVYRYEPLPPGVKPINSRFVFKIKTNQEGLVDRFKARLVVQGFRQRFGVDYLKTHASVCKMQTFRYQIAHAAQHDLKHEIIDVKSAYLEAKMNMPVYITIPGHPAPPGQAARLVTSLYGTKQAGHNWHHTIIPLLLEWGFKQSTADPCMFHHEHCSNDYAILCLFVDDFSITSTRLSTKSRDNFFKRLTATFKTSQADDNNVYVGIRCRQLAKHLRFLDQERYVIDMLHLYGFNTLRPVSTPTSGTILTKEMCPVEQGEKEAMAKVPYRQIVGSLRYLEQCTRPDISFALNRLSRYQVNPGQAHWTELKHLVRYVSSTRSYGLLYGKDGYPQHAVFNHDLSGPLECFVDSDHAADKDTRRSCTGYVFYSRGGPISWRSRLQNSTALSTCEAEFMAASDAGCENIWLRRLVSEYTNLSCTRLNGVLVPKDIASPKLSQQFFDNEVPTMFQEDNIGCIKVSEDPVLHGRMKHIDLRYHKLKEFVDNGTAKLIYMDTERQVADALTKSLTKAKFTPLRDCLVIDPFNVPSLQPRLDPKLFKRSTTSTSTTDSSKSRKAINNPSFKLPSTSTTA